MVAMGTEQYESLTLFQSLSFPSFAFGLTDKKKKKNLDTRLLPLLNASHDDVKTQLHIH